jgi:hypothetical protein
MDAEHAWQSALGQLQMEMPKASFDTWVRDTCLVSYEDGHFTIGVRNAYARDWMESRLSIIATRLLMGIMNRSVDLQFVVAEEGAQAVEQDEPEDDPDAVSEAQTDELLIEAKYELVYDEIVVPDHVTVVSGYFRRHLRVIGPDLGWLYLGFRQSAFNAGGRSGTRRERFSGQSIAALSGIAVSTFWNRIGKAETWECLKGLVTTSATTPEWDTSSSTPRRLPRKYVVSMTLPLTAVDARSLRTWLATNLERLGGPEKVIEAATETQLDELLPQDAQVEVGDSPESVMAIVRSLFGEILPAERLEVLSTRLHKHIMPDKDRLGVTHFFVAHILPYLGTGPGWMLTLLRDRCWVNHETGEARNQVTVHGGFAEIGDWLGVTPETIWRWLYGKHSESRGRSKPGKKIGVQRGPGRKATEVGKLSFPILSVYLRETTVGKTYCFATSPRTFDVLADEIPVEIIEASLDEQAEQALIHALAGDSDLRAVCSIAEPDSRAVCSIGFARFVVSESSIPARFVDDNRAVCSIVFARFVDHLRAVCRVFKSLNLLNPISNDSPTSPQSLSGEQNAQRSTNSGRGMGNQAFWDFDFLMQNNHVAKANDLRQHQKATGASIKDLAQGFVSWLLYAYSPSGRRIEDPVALATKRLLENIHASAGGDFDRLACLRPFELKALFDRDLSGDLCQDKSPTLEQEIYIANYRNLDTAPKKELYRRLFGSV